MAPRWEAHVRHRWFPWPTDNVVFGRTMFVKSRRLNAPTIRHEGTHVRQYATRGWWWVLTNPKEREAEAHAAETAAYPTWR